MFIVTDYAALIKPIPHDKEAAFLELHLSISNDIVSTEIYDKRDNFDFEIVNFPFQMVMLLALCF